MTKHLEGIMRGVASAEVPSNSHVAARMAEEVEAHLEICLHNQHLYIAAHMEVLAVACICYAFRREGEDAGDTMTGALSDWAKHFEIDANQVDAVLSQVYMLLLKHEARDAVYRCFKEFSQTDAKSAVKLEDPVRAYTKLFKKVIPFFESSLLFKHVLRIVAACVQAIVSVDFPFDMEKICVAIGTEPLDNIGKSFDVMVREIMLENGGFTDGSKSIARGGRRQKKLALRAKRANVGFHDIDMLLSSMEAWNPFGPKGKKRKAANQLSTSRAKRCKDLLHPESGAMDGAEEMADDEDDVE
jgi:hypothetical protein